MNGVFEGLVKECIPIVEDVANALKRKRVYDYLKQFEGKYIIQSDGIRMGGYADYSFVNEPILLRYVTPFYMVVKTPYSPGNSRDDKILDYKYMNDVWILFVPPTDGYKKYNVFDGTIKSNITREDNRIVNGHFEKGAWVENDFPWE